jgi:hypothetical protein
MIRWTPEICINSMRKFVGIPRGTLGSRILGACGTSIVWTPSHKNPATPLHTQDCEVKLFHAYAQNVNESTRRVIQSLHGYQSNDQHEEICLVTDRWRKCDILAVYYRLLESVHRLFRALLVVTCSLWYTCGRLHVSNTFLQRKFISGFEFSRSFTIVQFELLYSC